MTKTFFTTALLLGAAFALPSQLRAQDSSETGSQQLKIAVNVTEGDAARVDIMGSNWDSYAIEDGFITIDPDAQPLTFSATKKDGVKYAFSSFEVSEPATAKYSLASDDYEVAGLTEHSVINLGVKEVPSQEIYVKANYSGVPKGMSLSDIVVITDCDRNTLAVNAGGYIPTDAAAMPLKIALGTNPDTYEKYSENYTLDVALSGPGQVEFTSPSVYSPKGWYCAGLTDDSELTITIAPIEHVMLDVPVSVTGVEGLPADALEFKNASYKDVPFADGKITVDQSKLPLQISINYNYKKEYFIKDVAVTGAQAYAEFDEYYNSWKVYGLTDQCAIAVDVEPVQIDWIYAPLKVVGGDPAIVSFMDANYEGVKVDSEGRLKIDPEALPISAGVLYQYSDTFDVAKVELDPCSEGDLTYKTDEDYPDWGVWYINHIAQGATVTVTLRRLKSSPIEVAVNVIADSDFKDEWLVINDNMDRPVFLADGKLSVTDDQLPLTFALDSSALPDPQYTLNVWVNEGSPAKVEKGQGSADDASSVWYRVSDINAQTVVNVEITKATGIDALAGDASRDCDLYNLQGIRVLRAGQPIGSLPAGIYVTDGRKILVK